jgi:hypothetical protein
MNCPPLIRRNLRLLVLVSVDGLRKLILPLGQRCTICPRKMALRDAALLIFPRCCIALPVEWRRNGGLRPAA